MLRFIKLRCKTCNSTTCKKRPIGSWCTDTEGCEKEVSALDGNKYFHYIGEVKPMLLKPGRKNNSAELWNEVDDFMQRIMDMPSGERFR